MRTIETIRLFYFVYTVYTVFIVLVSDYPFIVATVGLLSIWIVFLVYSLGYHSVSREKAKLNELNERNIKYPFTSISSWNIYQYLLSSAFIWLFSITTTKFYTGKDFVSVVSGLLGDESYYYSYQNYFVQNNISSFSFTKIPYIIMLFIITINMFWSILSFVLIKRHNYWYQWIYLFVSILAYLYFGIARGTNFESFIVFILLSYCLLQKSTLVSLKHKYLYIGAFIIIGLLMIAVFRYVVALRGVVFRNQLCPEISIRNDSFLLKYFSTLTLGVTSVFPYLGYGVYTIGVSFYDIVMNSITSIFAIFVPKGYSIFIGESLEYWLRHTIDLGVKWCPDYIKWVDFFGLPLFYIIVYCFGKITKYIQDGNYNTLLKNSMLAIVYIQMISFPVGNFLMTSSANKLMVVYILGWFAYYKVLKIRIHF